MSKDLKDMLVKELQEVVVGLGMPEDDAKAMRTKAPLISTINVLRAQKAEATTPVETVAPVLKQTEPTKVKSLVEPRDMGEERRVSKVWFGKADTMRKKLMKQLEEDPVSIIVPLEEGEMQGKVEWRTNTKGERYQVKISGGVATPQLNGFIFMIPKGVYYQVPRQVATLIANSEQQTLDAGAHISLDRTDPATGRPIRESLR